MKFDEFLGTVQGRARLATDVESLKAIRATLGTLSETMEDGESQALADQLPGELGKCLLENPNAGAAERFDLPEFFRRVSEREMVDLPVSVFHARCVLEVLDEVISPNGRANLHAHLPPDFDLLFAGTDRDLTGGNPAECGVLRRI